MRPPIRRRQAAASSSAARGLRHQARALGHGEQLAAALAQLAQLGRKTLGGEIAIRDEHRGSFAYQVLRVESLVVVDRRGKRHQHRGHAHGRELGYRERAGTADDQVGVGVGARHVFDERRDFRRHARFGIRGACRIDAAFAGLVAHVQRESGVLDRERHHGVEARGAETTADHEQAQRALAAREARGGRRLHHDLRAHRIADHARLDAGREGVRKRGQHARAPGAPGSDSNNPRWRFARG